MLAAIVVFCFCLRGFSETTNSFFEFVQKQSKRQYTQVPHEVLAFYYVWYGAPPGIDAWKEVDTNKHEIATTARFPVQGAYSSHDTKVMDWHIQQAKANGITGFIVSWFGRGGGGAWHDRALALLLERAEKQNFKISVYWETAPGGLEQVERAVQDVYYIIGKFGKSPSFLKVDGKPVIFAYDRITSEVPASSWPEIFRKAHDKAGDFVLIMDGYKTADAFLSDGLHTYAFAGMPNELWGSGLRKENLSDLRQWVAGFYKSGVELARRHGRISCAMVTPGFDARKAYKFTTYRDRLDGQVYRMVWEEAIKANPDWVLITSWNEWPEGTEIEPSYELGDKYLQITAEYSQRFITNAPFKISPVVTEPPKFSPGTTQPLEKLFTGRKTGIIQDGMTEAEFWAAYCGAALQRMNWADLIDPKVFNASNYPVLIHIGGEHYTSSVKTTDDVTRALVRYLRQGGFLVSLPTSTWPLLYDDSRKGIPHGITDTLALGIDNGFEQPPTGARLNFYAKTNVLFGLSATALFPSAGDLRWRPANRTRVPATDAYTPLVQLKDDTGQSLGDAVAYIEHRTGSLYGGKSLYVWMRTAESFGSDDFLPSLYQFISTRLKPLPQNQ